MINWRFLFVVLSCRTILKLSLFLDEGIFLVVIKLKGFIAINNPPDDLLMPPTHATFTISPSASLQTTRTLAPESSALESNSPMGTSASASPSLRISPTRSSFHP